MVSKLVFLYFYFNYVAQIKKSNALGSLGNACWCSGNALDLQSQALLIRCSLAAALLQVHAFTHAGLITR